MIEILLQNIQQILPIGRFPHPQVIGLEYPRKMNPNFIVLNWSNDQESQFMTLLIDAAKQKKLLNKT